MSVSITPAEARISLVSSFSRLIQSLGRECTLWPTSRRLWVVIPDGRPLRPAREGGVKRGPGGPHEPGRTGQLLLRAATGAAAAVSAGAAVSVAAAVSAGAAVSAAAAVSIVAVVGAGAVVGPVGRPPRTSGRPVLAFLRRGRPAAFLRRPQGRASPVRDPSGAADGAAGSGRLGRAEDAGSWKRPGDRGRGDVANRPAAAGRCVEAAAGARASPTRSATGGRACLPPGVDGTHHSLRASRRRAGSRPVGRRGPRGEPASSGLGRGGAGRRRRRQAVGGRVRGALAGSST